MNCYMVGEDYFGNSRLYDVNGSYHSRNDWYIRGVKAPVGSATTWGNHVKLGRVSLGFLHCLLSCSCIFARNTSIQLVWDLHHA